MLLSVSNLKFSYADVLVFEGVGFAVQENDRIGIVGDNGSGKTTLLKLICSELTPADGDIALKTNARIGWLRQSSGLNPANTLYEEMLSVNDCDAILERMNELERRLADDISFVEEYSALCTRYDAAGGYDLEYRIKKVLTGLGFEESSYGVDVSALSGGEKTRLAMAKLLVESPELILLDEPTNHLDAKTSEWLAAFLASYKGAVIIVSHNAAFLDAVCNRILDLRSHTAYFYNGNYSAYRLQRDMNAESEQRVYKRNVERAQELSDFAKRNMARASTRNMAKSRLKMLERIDLTPPESLSHERISFRFPETRLPYKELLITKGLRIGAGGKPLFYCADFTLLRGENLAITGANGTGKTSLLLTLLRKNPPLEGSIRFGGGVRASYFEQNVFSDIKKPPIDFIWDLYPSLSALDIRNMLATVGLRGEEVFIPVNQLSGGERARLMLLRLSLQKPNVLILDEPTNHLDAYSRGVLVDTLKNFFGSLILVSHDAELVASLNCRILHIEDGAADYYENGREFAKREPLYIAPNSKYTPKSGKAAHIRTEQPPSAEQKQTRGEPSSRDARRISAQRRQRAAELTELISAAEQAVSELEKQIVLPETIKDPIKLRELCERLDEQKNRLSEYEDEWLLLDES